MSKLLSLAECTEAEFANDVLFRDTRDLTIGKFYKREDVPVTIKWSGASVAAALAFANKEVYTRIFQDSLRRRFAKIEKVDNKPTATGLLVAPHEIDHALRNGYTVDILAHLANAKTRVRSVSLNTVESQRLRYINDPEFRAEYKAKFSEETWPTEIAAIRELKKKVAESELD